MLVTDDKISHKINVDAPFEKLAKNNFKMLKVGKKCKPRNSQNNWRLVGMLKI